MYYENKKERKFGAIIISIFLIIIIFLLLNLTLKTDGNLSTKYEVTKTAIEYDKTEKESVEDMLKRVTPCVVGISKLNQNGGSVFLENSTNILGLGSGVVISEDGYILTNEHVAGEKYSNCYVTLEDGKVYNGNVVWADSNIDLAMLKIEAYKLNYLDLADSGNIFLGQDVYAIGNPIGFEFQRTVTKGIVSGINRTLKIEEEENSSYMEDLIQTDSTINEGNSGGPLINENGKIIGITSVKLKSAEGMGFAVPINIVKPILEKFLQTGKFDEAYLGIFGYDKEVIPYLEENLDFDIGIYVAEVIKDGPAYNIGIRKGDIINKIDDYEITKMNDLKRYIYQKNPGEKVNLFVKRGDKDIEFEVFLEQKQ